MDTKEKFKLFVRNNPQFATYIKDGSMTWQKFYELYDMYGEESSVWNDFKEVTRKNSPTISDIVNMAKNIDINKLQDGVNSLSKAFGLFSELFINKDTGDSTYKPRALYRRFDD